LGNPRFQAHLLRSLAGAGLAVALIITILGLVDAFRAAATPSGVFTNVGDFHCFYDGALAARLGHDLYSAGGGGYIYPPLLAWALQPLTLLPRTSAAALWILGMGALIPLTAWLASAEFARRLRLSIPTLGIAAAAGLAVLLVADKLRRELVEGNCNLLIILAGVLALRWLTRRPWLAGAAIGLAINIKYLPLVFLPYLLLRGRFKAFAGAVLGAICFALLPAVTFGWQTNLGYLRSALGGLGNMGGPGHSQAAIKPLAWDKSLSIPSAMARWAEHSGIPGTVLAGTAVVALIALAIAWAIYRFRGVPMLLGRWGPAEDSPGRAGIVGVEWAMLSAGVLAFSPQTPARHLNIAIILCALAAVLVLYGRAPGRWVVLAGAIAFSAATVLPPAMDSTQWMLDAWRAISGASLCLLLFLYTVQWAGFAQACPDGLRDRSAPC
jgi:hypothetical protein